MKPPAFTEAGFTRTATPRVAYRYNELDDALGKARQIREHGRVPWEGDDALEPGAVGSSMSGAAAGIWGPGWRVALLPPIDLGVDFAKRFAGNRR